jgi:hypothetical protein
MDRPDGHVVKGRAEKWVNEDRVARRFAPVSSSLGNGSLKAAAKQRQALLYELQDTDKAPSAGFYPKRPRQRLDP